MLYKMKGLPMKLLILLIASTFVLEASYVKMQHYAASEMYAKVLEEAKRSFEDYNNPKLHLLWAKSAQKLGKTTVAMGAYERVLILEPNNHEATLALEMIYTQSHRVGLSTTPNEGTKKNKLKAKVNLSLGHDSNVNVNASGTALDAYYGVSVGIDKISSNFARATANISYLYNLETYDNWFIQSTLDVYAQSNFSAHLYDLTLPTAQVALGYTKGKYILYFPVSYNTIRYLNKNLLNIVSFTPRIRVSFLENGLWDTSLLYAQRNYIEQADTAKNATTYGIKTGIYWSTDNTQLHLSADYETRTADKSKHDRFITADFFTVDTSYKYYLTSSMIAEASYQFRYSNYSDDIGTAATPSDISRDDYSNEVDVRLSYLLNKDMELYVSDTYTKSLSTYIPAEYNKNVFLLGFQVRY